MQNTKDACALLKICAIIKEPGISSLQIDFILISL